jgi:ABC-type polysaccharide/polyol phosphate export permease
MNKNDRSIRYSDYAELTLRLLKKDLFVYLRESFIAELIDKTLWIGFVSFVVTHIMTKMGMPLEYGFFYTIGLLMAVPFWSTWDDSLEVFSDWEGANSFSYYSTLPMPFFLYLFQRMLFYVIKALILCICIAPILLIILIGRCNFAEASLLKFIVISVIALFFCASLTFFVCALSKNSKSLGHVCTRIILPAWFVGGIQYSWYSVNALNPIYSYICLFNPLLYVMEGLHSSILGSKMHLNFLLCVGVGTIITIIIFAYSAKNLKRRFDAI